MSLATRRGSPDAVFVLSWTRLMLGSTYEGLSCYYNLSGLPCAGYAFIRIRRVGQGDHSTLLLILYIHRVDTVVNLHCRCEGGMSGTRLFYLNRCGLHHQAGGCNLDTVHLPRLPRYLSRFRTWQPPTPPCPPCPPSLCPQRIQALRVITHARRHRRGPEFAAEGDTSWGSQGVVGAAAPPPPPLPASAVMVPCSSQTIEKGETSVEGGAGAVPPTPANLVVHVPQVSASCGLLSWRPPCCHGAHHALSLSIFLHPRGSILVGPSSWVQEVFQR